MLDKILIVLYCCCQALQAEEMSPKQKMIGMIGGVGWESTAMYYKLINQFIRAHLGGLNSAKILLYSVNYDQIAELEQQGKWDEVGHELAHAAKTLQDGLCTGQKINSCCVTL